MRIQIYLENEKETVTELLIANGIIELCKDTYCYAIDPTIIAKAILLATERKDTE
jgi:hypothetical protein